MEYVNLILNEAATAFAEPIKEFNGVNSEKNVFRIRGDSDIEKNYNYRLREREIDSCISYELYR